MEIFRSITGMVSVEIVSADVYGLLSAIAELGIEIFGARMKGELTLAVTIRRTDFRNLQMLCRRRGEKIIISSRMGIFWYLRSLLNRPVLLGGITALLFLTLFLPRHVLFVRVEGNQRIPTRQILEAAADSGICFGASRREVRSEQMKNALMEAVPQLQWAGVNTFGCLAVISVRERAEKTGNLHFDGIGSIIAACDGVVLTVETNRGTCLCQPGQAVTKGQVLISGYTDLGITIAGTQAEGEIFAQTRRKITVVTPLMVSVREEEKGRKVKYSLLVGKKRINLWKGSGIWEGSCGRMYEEYYITLPGGFQLPFALLKETVVISESKISRMDTIGVSASLEKFAEQCVLDQMVSGSIVSGKTETSEEADLCVLRGEYHCTEMIGRLRREKIGE